MRRIVIGGIVVVVALIVLGAVVGGGKSGTAAATRAPSGQVIFGTAVDASTMTVGAPVTSVSTSDSLGWIAYLSEAAGATSLTVTVANEGAGGAETPLTTQRVSVSNPQDNELAHAADATMASALGPGTYTFRYVRPSDSKVLATGTITITSAAAS